jgi:hypothetical protein
MVGLSRHLNAEQSAKLRERKEKVLNETKQLFEAYPAGTFTGRGNTKQDVQDRIRLFDEMLERVIAE